jgi:hypothetical protein
MKFTYEVITAFNSEIIKRTDSEGSEVWIPLDPANSDYQAYLNQLDNTPLEAETE